MVSLVLAFEKDEYRITQFEKDKKDTIDFSNTHPLPYKIIVRYIAIKTMLRNCNEPAGVIN